jgi:hypothetical protein
VPIPGGYGDRDHDGIPDSRDTYDNRRDRSPLSPGRDRVYRDVDRDGIEDHRDTYDNRRSPPYRRDDDWGRRDRTTTSRDRDSDHDGTPDRYDRTPYGERDSRNDSPRRPPPSRTGDDWGEKNKGGGTDGSPRRPPPTRTSDDWEKNKGGTDGGSRPPPTKSGQDDWDKSKDTSSKKDDNWKEGDAKGGGSPYGEGTMANPKK